MKLKEQLTGEEYHHYSPGIGTGGQSMMAWGNGNTNMPGQLEWSAADQQRNEEWYNLVGQPSVGQWIKIVGPNFGGDNGVCMEYMGTFELNTSMGLGYADGSDDGANTYEYPFSSFETCQAGEIDHVEPDPEPEPESEPDIPITPIGPKRVDGKPKRPLDKKPLSESVIKRLQKLAGIKKSKK